MDLLAPPAFPQLKFERVPDHSASSTAPATPGSTAALDRDRRCLLDASFFESLVVVSVARLPRCTLQQEPSATFCVNDESLTTKSLSTWEKLRMVKSAVDLKRPLCLNSVSSPFHFDQVLCEPLFISLVFCSIPFGDCTALIVCIA
ncbi:hypothetical protein H9Q69_011943 [Fusarium xylarioides]|nr:hypothetical protein H9Q70_013778 [Fusarium xylarioides]KAG5768121.1 hypothetical protein H9Q73_013942 [Fusarium xylarioides]KAG5788994.1 hypothetical protein H9Q69_011943 [Fusarium xylarioides]KAG5813986.1 hypothetical protein H9Q71_003441 [Fusarium xylarioides]KAG5826776.1 hypothetical protein H9Q74_003133 [Fusarium xylarioides]